MKGPGFILFVIGAFLMFMGADDEGLMPVIMLLSGACMLGLGFALIILGFALKKKETSHRIP
jgi:hypothetical protein